VGDIIFFRHQVGGRTPQVGKIGAMDVPFKDSLARTAGNKGRQTIKTMCGAGTRQKDIGTSNTMAGGTRGSAMMAPHYKNNGPLAAG